MATLAYPAPLDAARGAAVDYNESARDITTTVLVVGGGPVGMLQALILARLHKQPCMLLEREETTTIFPKMEYTNGRSMEIYRALGLAEELRKIGTQEVPEHYNNNEVLVTSLLTGGKVVDIWPHAGAAEQREIGKKQNDGSSYLEPHMRCYQIILERWLKEKIEAEPLITSHWGTAFVGLDEKDDHVITEAKIVSSEEKLRIKSQYVIGCDGGGSWVRKSANLESKRNYLNLTVAFVHYRSAELPKIMPGPRAWHHDVIGGGVTVSQNEKDLWTTHYMCPPDLDPTTLSIDEVLGLALGGCQGLVPVPYDEIYCRGVWKVDVAIANSFRSARGRVFLAGDAAHQLSPIGGHGLNSGLGDAYDLGWKLSAVLQGWAGEKLLASYTEERRAIAFENLDHVQEGLGLIMPIFGSPQKFGAAQINADGPEGEKIREQIKQMSQEGKWLHDQNGNILGANYKQSSVIDDHAETGQRPQQTHMHYNPNTWPGHRAPHLWLTNGASTHDILDPSQFNIVDFAGGRLSQPFLEAAKVLNLPVKEIVWDAKKESNARQIYERDLLVIRPDSYVAWRGADGASYSVEQATQILRSVTGQ